MADNNYATKQDLAALGAELRANVDARFHDVIEANRDMQTELLRAFHNWARPADIKSRSHEERLTLLEERISEIERGNKPS